MRLDGLEVFGGEVKRAVGILEIGDRRLMEGDAIMVAAIEETFVDRLANAIPKFGGRLDGLSLF